MFRFDLIEAFKTLAGGILDFLYPPYCRICGTRLEEDERVVCEGCWGEVKPLGRPFCPHCGYPLRFDARRCPMCQERKWSFRRVGVLASFGAPAQPLIHLLKYRGKQSVGRRLGALLSQVLQDSGWRRADMIIPVPLHRSRLRERGYNQSLVLAQVLGEELGKPLRPELLVRKQNTRSQVNLNIAQRMANVSGAFQVNHPDQVRGKRIIVVDDVITSGATADACSRSLLDAGAREVMVAAVAAPIGR